MEDSKLENKRVCSNCGSDKTYVRPNGWIQWNRDGKGGWYCNKCYNNIVTNPRWHKINNPKYNPRRIGFKRKRYITSENPRKGICKRCGVSKVRTELHHEQYDESAPFAHTIELCMKCHWLTKTIYRDRGRFISPPQ